MPGVGTTSNLVGFLLLLQLGLDAVTFLPAAGLAGLLHQPGSRHIQDTIAK